MSLLGTQRVNMPPNSRSPREVALPLQCLLDLTTKKPGLYVQVSLLSNLAAVEHFVNISVDPIIVLGFSEVDPESLSELEPL